MEKKPKGFQRGHTKHGGAQKGKKKDIDESVKADYYWADKKIGGREALLAWARDPKSANDEFFKQFKSMIGGTGGKGGSKEKRIVFVRETQSDK